MCCSAPCFLVLLCSHYGPLQCLSTKFRKLKEIEVLRPICKWEHLKETILKEKILFSIAKEETRLKRVIRV